MRIWQGSDHVIHTMRPKSPFCRFVWGTVNQMLFTLKIRNACTHVCMYVCKKCSHFSSLFFSRIIFKCMPLLDTHTHNSEVHKYISCVTTYVHVCVWGGGGGGKGGYSLSNNQSFNSHSLFWSQMLWRMPYWMPSKYLRRRSVVSGIATWPTHMSKSKVSEVGREQRHSESSVSWSRDKETRNMAQRNEVTKCGLDYNILFSCTYTCMYIHTYSIIIWAWTYLQYIPKKKPPATFVMHNIIMYRWHTQLIAFQCPAWLMLLHSPYIHTYVATSLCVILI